MNPRDLVYTPSQIAELTHEHLERLQATDKTLQLNSGIDRIDSYLLPFSGGSLTAVLARPGHGKSSFVAHYAREAAKKSTVIGDKSRFGPPVVITAEMSVEDYSVRELSHHASIDSTLFARGEISDWGKIHDLVEKTKETHPIVYFGHSAINSKRRPSITIDNIWKGLEYLVDEYDVKPGMIALDYLQRLRMSAGGKTDRRLELSEVMNSSKDIALSFDTAVIIAVQAGRSVDEKVPPVPGLQDGQETSAVEQVPETVLSIWKPSRSFKVGEEIPGIGMTVTENLFYLKVLKQRGGLAGKGFFLHFDMSVTRLSDLELIHANVDTYIDEEDDEDGSPNW